MEIYKKIVHFGLERIPSFIAQSILLAGPSVLLSMYGTFAEVALIDANISIIRLLILIIGPFGIIILPKIVKFEKKNF